MDERDENRDLIPWIQVFLSKFLEYKEGEKEKERKKDIDFPDMSILSSSNNNKFVIRFRNFSNVCFFREEDHSRLEVCTIFDVEF